MDKKLDYLTKLSLRFLPLLLQEQEFLLCGQKNPSQVENCLSCSRITRILVQSAFVRLIINGDDAADSKDLFEAYRLLATLGDNDLVNMLVKLLYDSEVTTKSYDIGTNGRYFIIPYSKP